MSGSRLALIALAASAALAAGAGAASAATPPHTLPQPPATRAVTYITDRPDGGNAGYWADDTMTRTLVITETGGSAGDYKFTATLEDQGSFRTIPGALAPDQGGSYAGETERAAVTGEIIGSADFTFTASTLPSSSLVPGYENDHGLTPADDTSAWYELAFPAGTVFGGSGIGTWGWYYVVLTPHDGLQIWSDTSSNADGDAAGDGQITG
jgi:hypothetical protein